MRRPGGAGMPAAAASTAAAPLALSSAPGLLRTLSRWARTSNVSWGMGRPRVAMMFTPGTGPRTEVARGSRWGTRRQTPRGPHVS